MRLVITDLDTHNKIFTVTDTDTDDKVKSNPTTLRNVLRKTPIVNAKLTSNGFIVASPITLKPIYEVILEPTIIIKDLITIEREAHKKALKTQANNQRQAEKAQATKKVHNQSEITKQTEVYKSPQKDKPLVVKSRVKAIKKANGTNSQIEDGVFQNIYYRGKMYVGINHLLHEMNPSNNPEFNNRFKELYKQGYSIDVCLGKKEQTSENPRLKALKELNRNREEYYSTEISEY